MKRLLCCFLSSVLLFQVLPAQQVAKPATVNTSQTVVITKKTGFKIKLKAAGRDKQLE